MGNSNLKRKPETEVVLSAIFTKNRQKCLKIAGNQCAFREFESPRTQVGPGDALSSPSDSDSAECNIYCHCNVGNLQLATHNEKMLKKIAIIDLFQILSAVSYQVLFHLVHSW